MALPETFRFSELIIAIGDGASPEIFGQPCGLTSKSFGGTATTNEVNVPDCDDPDAPFWVVRDVISLARDINGSGLLDKKFLDDWDDFLGSVKNCKVKIGDFEWTGPYILTTFNVTGANKGRLEVTVAMQSTGEITRATVSV